MKILLDTHILIWLHLNDKRLSEKARQIILDLHNKVFYSSVNIWEAQIKHLKHPKDFQFSGEALDILSAQANLTCLYVKPAHCIVLKTLSFPVSAPVPHNDPFDRILICQAKVENMLLLTHDDSISYYNESCILKV